MRGAIRRAEVISLLKEIGSFGVAERRNLKAGFFSMLPGHDRLYLRRSLLGTANVGDLLKPLDKLLNTVIITSLKYWRAIWESRKPIWRPEYGKKPLNC